MYVCMYLKKLLKLCVSQQCLILIRLIFLPILCPDCMNFSGLQWNAKT